MYFFKNPVTLFSTPGLRSDKLSTVFKAEDYSKMFSLPL